METECFLYITGRRQDSKLIYLTDQKQLYKKKSTYKGKTFYTCYRDECKARVEMLPNDICVKCKKNSEHSNHPDQEDFYNELVALNAIKSECMNQAETCTTRNASKIARKVFQHVCNSKQDSTKSLVFPRMRRNLEKLSSRKRKEKALMKQTGTPTSWELYSRVDHILGKYKKSNGIEKSFSPRDSDYSYENSIAKSKADQKKYVDNVVICRTCLNECRKYKSLYNYGFIKGEKTTLGAILTFCTNLTLSEQESPNLPGHICSKCEGDLLRTYFFIKRVLDADNALRSEHNDSYNFIHDEDIQDQCNVKIERLTDDEHDHSYYEKEDGGLIEYILQDDVGDDGVIVKTEENDYYASETNFENPLNIETNTKFKSKDRGVPLVNIKEVPAIVCKVCNDDFKDRSTLKRHMQLHSYNTPYKCKICGKVFQTLNAYEGHISRHVPNVCKVCGKTFRQLRNLEAHLKTHSNDVEIFTCEICDKKCMHKGGYKVHMLIHNGENRSRAKPFACDICGQGFFNYKKLFRHREYHGGFRKYKCTKCCRRFPNAEKLKRHAEKHRESLLCHVCCQTFSRETSLVIHFLRSHGQENDE